MVKQDYVTPIVEVVEMSYREPVCQAKSGEIPDYDVVTPGDGFFA